MAKAKEKKPVDKSNKDAIMKSVKDSMDEITKLYGEGSIMRLGDNLSMNIEVIPTGSLNLNSALGGGVPRGRIVEIYGAESSGKTTLALHIIAEAQKMGGVVAFIDAEHALDPVYAKNLGVDIDELLISQPDYGEQALEIADALVRSSAIDVIVVDSVAALVPKAEIDGVMSDMQMGLHARLMAKGLRKLTASLNRTKTTLIFINQVREKIGGSFGYGGITTTTTGGRALKFFASVRMEVKRVGSIKSGDETVGNETTVKVTKNKVAPPFKEAKFQIMYGTGISQEGEYMDFAEAMGIISKSGSWLAFEDVRIQGKENLRERFKTDKELYERLKNAVNEGIASGKLESKKGKKKSATKAEDSVDDEALELGEDFEEDFDTEE